MAMIDSISELSAEDLRNTWCNSHIMYCDLYNFYSSSLLSVLEDNGYEIEKKHLGGTNYLEELYMCVSCRPVESLLDREIWVDISDELYLGVWLDDEKDFQMEFSVLFTLQQRFDKNYFQKNAKANTLKCVLEESGWIFEYNEDSYWEGRLVKPVEEINFNKPTWKKELKRFYETALSLLSETFFDTKVWLDN